MVLVRPSLNSLQRQAQWLALLLLAISLHVFEASIPSLGPWFKPGLANIVTVVCLALMGPRAAVTLALARVVAGSFFIGTMLTPTFMLSLSGTMAATLIMLLAWRYLPGVSLIGVSLLGALAHMLAQFVVVEAWFIQQPSLYYLLPPLLLLSCASGWLNGAVAQYIVGRGCSIFTERAHA
jgi:heptaprenyl diphosphate synthase